MNPRGLFAQQPKSLNVAMEENATGKAEMETELVFYARIADRSKLALATLVEDHEQWELKIPKSEDNQTSMRQRVRKTTGISNEAAPVYVFTTKTKPLSLQAGEMECSIPSTIDQFNQFRMASGRGMIKRRYVFPIEGRDCVWEVDTFKMENGQDTAWCKIDLEIKDGNFTRPPFPEGLFDETEILTASSENIDVRNKVSHLYDAIFIKKNPSRGVPAEPTGNEPAQKEPVQTTTDPDQSDPAKTTEPVAA